MEAKAEEVYKSLFAQVNGPSYVFEKEFRRLFRAEHPTLQQAFIRHVVRAALEELADSRKYADARNRGATDFAIKALEAVKGVGLPTI